eukprot:29956-Ditylum_brightwellii.AAC.1
MSKCELEDPKKTSTWRKLELPEEILHYLKVHNRHHFGQAHGEYSNEEVSELQQLLLKNCKAENYDQLVRTKITRKVWKGKVAA